LNANGQLGDSTTTNRTVGVAVSGLTSDITAISAGLNHSLAIRNGAVYAWGLNNYGQLGDGTTTNRINPLLLGGTLNGLVVTQIAAGDYHSLALTSDFRLFAWGRNAEGQLGNASFLNSSLPSEVFAPSGFYWSSISGGGLHSLATLTAVPEPSATLLTGLTILVAGICGGMVRRNELHDIDGRIEHD
jgi:alpha-tubulin suppressor-like RCC1 family protein